MKLLPLGSFRNVIIVFLVFILVFVYHGGLFYSSGRRSTSLNNDKERTVSYNLWCIFTKAEQNFKLRSNFRRFIKSALIQSTVPVSLHVISDNKSVEIAGNILRNLKDGHNATYSVEYHDVHNFADLLGDIVNTMQAHFSSQPGSYYSDVLFFLSIGLHRVTNQSKAVMIDIDTELRVDIKQLFDEFENMPPTAVIAAAPEQSPVYRHTLHMYRAANRETSFGNPVSYGGNPGLNSGVLLLNLARQRKSRLYQKLLHRQSVAKLCAKYQFHGHLGDQDWYTLLSEEHPALVHFLDCTWNRQLCLWWRHHGYHDVFDLFHYCPGDVKIYHGNCNTDIPSL